jgi:hypothetical protein
VDARGDQPRIRDCRTRSAKAVLSMGSSVSGEFVHSPEDGRVESAALRRSPLIECVEYATTATVAG